MAGRGSKGTTLNIDELFDGYAVQLDIAATGVSPAQAEVIRQSLSEEPPQKLRFNCIIAEGMNESLGGGPNRTKGEEYAEYEIGGTVFKLNPKGRSQFGMDKDNVPYLTTSLVDTETGTRYGLTWRGDAIPFVLKETAVAHDEGRRTAELSVSLEFADAEKHIIGNKDGG